MSTTKENDSTTQSKAVASTKKRAAKKTAVAKATPPATRTGMVGWLGLLAGVAALAGGYTLWQQNQLLQRQLSSLQGQQLTQQRQADQWRTILNDSEQSLATQLDTQSQQLNGVQATVNGLLSRIDRDRSAWQRAEIEHLLKIANQQLQLNHDVRAALQALETADRGIFELGDPILTGVREALSTEIQTLKALPDLDLTGLVLTLGTLQQQVTHLPLRDQPKTATIPAVDTADEGNNEGWRAAADKMLASLRGLVTIRRQEQAVMPLLAPEQRYFLYQNLQLRLETARLALLRRDSESYRDSLITAKQWVLAYFDNQASATQAMVNGLDALAVNELSPKLPDISASLNALRSLKVKQAPAAPSIATEPQADQPPAKEAPQPAEAKAL